MSINDTCGSLLSWMTSDPYFDSDYGIGRSISIDFDLVLANSSAAEGDSDLSAD